MSVVIDNSVHRTFLLALASRSLGQHDELLHWLYQLVEMMGEQRQFSADDQGEQKFVGQILKTTFDQLPRQHAELLEAVELGGETLGVTARKMALSEEETIRMLNGARAEFVELLRTGAVPLCLASID